MQNFKVLIAPKRNFPIKAWVNHVPLEEEAKQQLFNTADMPFVTGLSVMPDVHWGMGATIGSVMVTRKAVIPAAVGVDIGCGMMAQKTSLTQEDIPDDLLKVRTAIERVVPRGKTWGKRDEGAWTNPPDRIEKAFAGLNESSEEMFEKHPKIARKNINGGLNHLGTMGTGNHFLELCTDEEGSVWIMLHSGSRGIGNTIGRYFIEKAKILMERYLIDLPDKDLSYLPLDTEEYHDYIQAVNWCQNYALVNREVMMSAAIEAMKSLFPEFYLSEVAVNCHHNYVTWENHKGENVIVTRKGAVRARVGDLGIIPGSMGVKSYIVEGLGNPDSFNSCSHGAGRAMSRREAKKRYTAEDHVKATEGVECRKDKEVIDEIPMAYKDIDNVMESQKDLVKIKHTLKQFICVKG